MDKLVFHYQYVSHASNIVPTVHEAYSRGSTIELLNPSPALIQEDDTEMQELIEMDYIKYGVVSHKNVRQAALRYIDHTGDGMYGLPDYSSQNVDDEESVEDDFYDDDDKVIPIDEYIKRRG